MRIPRATQSAIRSCCLISNQPSSPIPAFRLRTAYNAVSPLVLGRPMDTAYVDQLLDDCKAFLVKPRMPILSSISTRNSKPPPSRPPRAQSIFWRAMRGSPRTFPMRAAPCMLTVSVTAITRASPGGVTCTFRGIFPLRGALWQSSDARPPACQWPHLPRRPLWCHEIDCTTCFADGIRQFSIRAAATLWGFMMACHSGAFCLKASGPLHHVVVSCNAEDGKLALDRSGRVELRRKYIDVLRNLGRYCTRCELDAPDCSCIRLKHADGRCKLCTRKSERCKCVDDSCHTGGYHGGGMVFHGCRFTEGGLCPVWGASLSRDCHGVR